MIDWLFQESHARHSRGSLSDIRRASYAALPDSAVYASLRDWKTSRLTSRLEAYHAQTQPVIDYYQTAGRVQAIAADKPSEQVAAKITSALA